ncbi:MAG: hypothetical protein IPL26_08260 [Leptospiraceae bacterium]|nr:hypothetical protein [Leptospiraceae bacterium]
MRILETANELIISIARGGEPTARCKHHLNVGLTLRKVSYLFCFWSFELFITFLKKNCVLQLRIYRNDTTCSLI